MRFSYTTRLAGKYHTVLGEQRVPGDEAVELRLPESEPERAPGGRIEGIVVDEDGVVLTEHGLRLRRGGRSLSPSLNGHRFRFDEVPRGDWTLTVTTDEGAKKVEQAVHVRSGDTATLRVVMGLSITFRGQLVDEAGKGIAGTYVQLRREGDSGTAGRKRTGADGRFEMGGLLPGRYRARVRQRAGAAAISVSDALFEVRAGASEVHVIQAQPASLLIVSLGDDRFLTYSPNWSSQSNTVRGQRTLFSRMTVITGTGEELSDIGLFNGKKAFAYPLAEGSYDLVIKTMITGSFRESFRTSFSITAGRDTIVPVVIEE